MSERKVGPYAEETLSESLWGDAVVNGITLGAAIGLYFAIAPQNPNMAETILNTGVIFTTLRFGSTIENIKIRRLIERGQ